MREFALIGLHAPSAAAAPTGHDVPIRLVELVDELRAGYAAVTAPANTVRDRVVSEGRPRIDLTYVAPRTVGPAMARLGLLLEEADEFCRTDRLLILATPPEERRFRDWYVGEVVRQSRGEAPQPWAASS